MNSKQYLLLDGYKLAYQSFNAMQKDKIFLVHGNSGSSHMWRKQTSSSTLSSFHLIVFDLPCHGDSDDFGFPSAEMDLPAVAGVLNQAVERLSPGGNYILAGLSLGTCVIAEMIRLGAAPAGIILLGPCVFDDPDTLSKMVKPGTGVEVCFQDGSDEKAVAAYAGNTSLSRNPEDLKLFLADYFQVTDGWRTRLGASLPVTTSRSEWQTLKTFEHPSLIVFGREEKIVDTAYLDHAKLPLWNNEIVLVPGASHLVNIDQPEAVNALIESYATEVFSEKHHYA